MTRDLHSASYVYLRTLLIKMREESGLTQLQLAQKIGKPQSFISKYERGERKLDVIEFIKICNATMGDPAELINNVKNRIKNGNS